MGQKVAGLSQQTHYYYTSRLMSPRPGKEELSHCHQTKIGNGVIATSFVRSATLFVLRHLVPALVPTHQPSVCALR